MIFLSNRSLLTLATAALLAVSAAPGAVVINEILYQPAGIPENVLTEFIELHNTDGVAADVAGWKFTAGIDFTFPAGTAIPAGGYLVVAANVSAFQAAHPGVTNVVGDWTGALSNLSEKIKLVNALGGTEDSVEYASEGDWARRGRDAIYGGWEWQTLAAGGGRSLELRNPAIDNDRGQNWGDSTVAGGTPGAVNGLATSNVAPLIKKVRHSPAVPKSTEAVTISCELADEGPPASLAATLFWRNATSTSPGAFLPVPMSGDGAGAFAAALPAMANLTIVEFYVQAGDGTLNRTWPAPTTEGQNANCQYQVDNATPTAGDSFYRLVLTGAENAAFNSLATSDPYSDRQFNQTLVVSRGSETTIRYRSSMRIRGNSSRTYQIKPLRVTMPNDDRWDGQRDFNLNPKGSYLQYLGMRMFQAAGVRASDAIPVELRRNGMESTTSTGGGADFGKWVRVEEINGDMVGNHWPEADTGNLYKKGRPDRYWRNTGWTVPGNPDGLIDGWSKQNNGSANDWTDLTNFFAVVQSVTTSHFPGAPANDTAESTGSALTGIGSWNGTALTTGQVTTLETVADLDQWAKWFAVTTVLQDSETKICNGQDDDYSAYFVPAAGGQRRLQFIPHDLDTIFGLGDSQLAFNARGLFDATAEGSVFRPLLALLGNSTTTGNAAFRTKYFTALRELYGSVFDADTKGGTVPNPPFYSFLDNHLADWLPEATVTAMKTFATDRQAYLLGLIGSPAITPPAATSAGTVTSAHGDVMISEVFANNVAAENVGGAFPDIIELHNAGASSADLAGRSITDDPAAPAKYVFPAGTTIAPGGYLVLFADNGPGAGHLPFALSNDGEGVHLYESPANGGAALDSVVFGVQPANYTIGRTGPTLDTWTLCTPTIGSANTAIASLAPPGGLRINEWLANPDYQFDDDFIELWNAAAAPVAVGGMFVTDDFINYPARQPFPPLSFIAPASFLGLNALGGNATPGDATELAFSLDSTAGWVALIGQNGTIVDRVDIISQPPDTTTGRTPDGAATFARLGLPTGLATPGASNATPPASVLALMHGLRVTEILYKPDTHEFIELQNIGATALNLSGVRFSKGIGYTFDPGTTLAPGAFIVICRNRTSFLAQFGSEVPLAGGNFTGSLDNAGESIAFRPPPPYDASILNFAYDPTWHPATNSGSSLTVVKASGTVARAWGDKATWMASPVLYGTPGHDGPPEITSTLSASGIVGSAFLYQISATKNPASFNAAPLPPGLSVNPTSGLIDGTPTSAGTFAINVSATNTGGTTNATLTLTIATSGPLAGFAWSNIPSPQQGDAPFPVTLTAQDAQGRTVASFNGPVSVAGAIPGGGNGATIVFTECGIASVDSWELQNVSSAPINTSGWFVIMNNSVGVNTIYSPINLPSSLAAGEIFYRHEDSSDSAHYFGFTISWPGGGPSWIMLVDNSGAIRDFFVWGSYTEADIAAINVTANGFTLRPTFQGAWSGPGEAIASNLNNTQALVRTGSDDHGNESDWSIAPASRGAQNAGLTLPFPGGPTNAPVLPSSITFENGVFTGTLRVGLAGTGIRITANDGLGHTGQSNAFDVVAPPAPVVTSPGSALAVVGQAFSYQIVATNAPTSFNATNLPSGLGINAATGLISGVPSTAGSKSVALSASNFGGAGNANLSLQVQADADGDGMGDAWETASGLNPAVNDSAADLDGDGQGNRAEWLAGTAPNNSNSRLAILSEQTVGGDFQIAWSSVAGKRYRILTLPDFTGSSWIDLTPAPLVATSTSTSWTHVGGMAGPTRYYRIELVP